MDNFHTLTRPNSKVGESDSVDNLIKEIKESFRTMGDEEIYPSAYDTAWVARVPAIDGSLQPQFPQTLQWIIRSQSANGSWGHLPTVYDQLLDTLACIVTLTIWRVGDTCVQKGIEFIRKHAEHEQDTSEEAERYNSRLCGFRIIFAATVNEAKALGLQLPYQLPLIKKMTEEWKTNVERIPINVLHTTPTTWLCCLEGLQDVVDWRKIMNLQSSDGSFLSSPASTACVFMHTGDSKCLEFLTFVLRRFGDNVPCLYPIDLMERLWAVDTVERLAIDRHFREEIKGALDYVYRCWNNTYGIGWARHNAVADLHDTAMGIRILRLHGYSVSPDVLQHFKKQNGDFFCHDGNTRTGIMDVLSLYRCSLVQFPGEQIMEEAKVFATNHLRNALADHKTNGSNDKLSPLGEVEYAMEYGWHASVPRQEARCYIEQLGLHLERVKAGTDHVWLGKIHYKVRQLATNEKYLQLAKLDFKRVRALYQTELQEIYKAAWTKTCFLVTAIDDLYDSFECHPKDLRIFSEAVQRWNPSLVGDLSDEMKICFHALYTTVNELATEASNGQGRDVFGCLHRTWVDMISSFSKVVEWWEGDNVPTFEEYVENGIYTFGLEPVLVHSAFLTGDRLPDNIVQQFDLRSKSLIHFMCLTGRLVNDSKISKAVRSDRGEFPWAIMSYLKDNPQISENEVLSNISRIVENAFNQLNWELVKPSDVPHRSKVLVFNTARACQVMNLHGDGFNNPDKKIKDIITKFFFEPVQ